jgi:hypothetical protein
VVNTEATVIAATKHWLEHAVIGLNLCPFAKAVHVKDQIRYVVSVSTTTEELLDVLERELVYLRDADAASVDTTLLMLPDAFAAFSKFVDFLDLAEVTLRTHGLVGVLQIASFHPEYVFADAEFDAVANCTNRSPFPTLHLLREASLSRATQAYPNAAAIFERNIEALESLGYAGWQALNTVAGNPLEKDK